MYFNGISPPELSGERFQVTYRIWGNEKEALSKAEDVCIEQTVEFPGDLVPKGPISDSIVGKVESFEAWGESCYRTVISYAVECASGELLQLLNVVFGNTSIKPGIRVEHIRLPQSLLSIVKGPRFGKDGIRKLLGIPKRPILFTALKPMGLSAEDLANLAYQFALGGIDIIKDDHGLSNQSFSPYEKRVKLCAEAVAKANKETGYHCIYVPNIVAPFYEMTARAKYAKEAGAGAVLIAPGLTGIDTMRIIAEDDSIGLPVFSHPAFQGSYVIGQYGIAHTVLFGQIARMAGADATIFPNYGGRFCFSIEQCRGIASGAAEPMGGLKPIFVCPAGGMGLDSIPDSIKAYGHDVILLIGGGLFRHGPDIVENSRYFRQTVEGLA